MVDWTASMQQTFEFYTVNPDTWKDEKKLSNIKSCSISRDMESDTLISATFDVTELVGECYIRVYLITIQNGVTEKHPLGTFLVQTPSSNFDGLVRSVSMDAYSPLLELSEKKPPFGYFIKKGGDVMEYAYNLAQANMRAPVNEPFIPSTKLHYDFVADTNDTYLNLVKDLVGASAVSKFYEVIPVFSVYKKDTTDFTVENFSVASNMDGVLSSITLVDDNILYRYTGDETDETNKTYTKSTYYKIDYLFTQREIDSPYTTDIREITPSGTLDNPIFSYTNKEGTSSYFTTVDSGYISYRFELDGLGRVTFAPNMEAKYMTPIWTYTDDNSSILEPSISMQHDIYGIPNVVEVIYSTTKEHFESVIKNEDENSPTSIQARGREIIHRVINPDLHGQPTQELVDKYAEDLLSALSSVEYTISYSHGYCPVNIGDCVRLNYTRAGLANIKAKVISQTIKCRTGCTVSEKAIFTHKLWR